jgi:hypothetical protein
VRQAKCISRLMLQACVSHSKCEGDGDHRLRLGSHGVNKNCYADQSLHVNAQLSSDKELVCLECIDVLEGSYCVAGLNNNIC